MARITVNETGTQPVIQVSTNIANVETSPLGVICLQDITITNSTGVYSYTDFCNTDMQKLPTPADNEIATNIVIDDEVWFGNASLSNTTAGYFGLSQLSIDKTPLSFRIYWNGTANGAYYTEGTGFITSLAPTVNPEAPVWVSPLTIAVDGSMSNDTV
jgi:hypothetical protein